MNRLGCLLGLSVVLTLVANGFALAEPQTVSKTAHAATTTVTADHALVRDVEHDDLLQPVELIEPTSVNSLDQAPWFPKPTVMLVVMFSVFTLLGGRHLVSRRR